MLGGNLLGNPLNDDGDGDYDVDGDVDNLITFFQKNLDLHQSKMNKAQFFGMWAKYAS